MRACHARHRIRGGAGSGLEWDKMLNRPATVRAHALSSFPCCHFHEPDPPVSCLRRHRHHRRTLGHSLLAQFPDTRFRRHRMPFIDSPTRPATGRCGSATRHPKPACARSSSTPGRPRAPWPACAAGPVPRPLREVHRPLENEAPASAPPSRRTLPRHRRSQDYKRRIEAINFTSPTTTASPTPTWPRPT